MNNVQWLRRGAILGAGMALFLGGKCVADDARYYQALKGQSFVQNDASAPLLQATNPFVFRASVEKCSSIGLSNVSLQLPAGGGTILLQPDARGFSLLAGYSSQSQLDAAFPDGTYTVTIQTLSDGSKAAPLTVATATDLSPPHISNWTDVQTVDADADFILRWDPFANGGSSDLIQVTVRDNMGNIVFATSEPVIVGQTGVLNGTETSVLIPGETLISGRNYSAEISFARLKLNTNSYPGVVGAGGYYASTSFSIRTVDVRNYGVLKGQIFYQTAPAALVSTGYVFDVFVNSSSPLLGVLEARYKVPGIPFSPLPPPDFYVEEGPYPTIGDLNAAFPNGTYFLAFKTLRDGTKSPSLAIAGDAYPIKAPLVSDFAALQTMNAGADFTLTWGDLGGTTNDFVHVEIDAVPANPTNSVVWATPEEGDPGALNGTNTSVTIPGSSLVSGTDYLLYLTYEKATLDRNAYPGATGIAGYYNQTLSPFRTIDLFGYTIMKGQVCHQTNSGSPTLQQYEFSAFVDAETGTTNLTQVAVQVPSLSTNTILLNSTNHFEITEAFPDKNTLDAQAPPGNYVFTHYTVHDGIKAVTNRLRADSYPAATPRIANFDAAQTINCGADFILTWDPLIGSNTNQFVWVAVDEASSEETVFASPWVGYAGALNGGSTSFLIPAHTLRAGYSYQITVMHAALTVDMVSYPGAIGLTGFNKQTQFMLTVPGTPFPKRIEMPVVNNSTVGMTLVGELGRTNILETASTLLNPIWMPVVTNVGTADFSGPIIPPAGFFRLRDATAAGP